MLGKFKSPKEKEVPVISTASLPDIVLMLLFFFMVTAVMRETNLLVEQHLPSATQLTKLQDPSLVSHIYIGKPKDTQRFGHTELIQMNDVLVNPRQVPQLITQENQDVTRMTVSLKVDRQSKMGLVSDVKLKLREANARKINYSAVGQR
ncbi:MAG TPA: biopolymer transporter ExbD [Microscillaceae bacterium]|nr:biopolymer transporter ExbD [Microscillaceae bacterium]